jgi:hypothetical protein
MVHASFVGLPFAIGLPFGERSGRNTRLVHGGMGSIKRYAQISDKLSERPRYRRGARDKNIVMPFTA